jgi:hypothetical protein
MIKMPAVGTSYLALECGSLAVPYLRTLHDWTIAIGGYQSPTWLVNGTIGGYQ